VSGFVAVVNLDGAPVDRDVLARMTGSMAYRGPDAQETWINGSIGLGSALLRTTFEAQHEHQPCTLDGEVWIAADCRIDARDDLIGELRGHGRNATPGSSDPELILHAYAVWGADCVAHLLGDFSFAIWDARVKSLVCARDHMGVRLLYHTRAGGTMIVSNSLEALRLHPSVSRKLNELAIADFLLFGVNQDATTTSYEGVRRLVAGHRMQWSGGEPRIERYWELPIDPPTRFRRRREYTEHFLELLTTVLRDRMRTERAGIMMSGGLDSAGMAAVGRNLASVKAYTTVFDSLLPDKERYYAAMVASHLKIPICFVAEDDSQLFEVYPDTDLRRIPDPTFISCFGPDTARKGILARMVADGTRIALHGEGPDNALVYEWKPYARHELAQWKLGSLVRDAISFPFLFGQMPHWSRLFRRARPGRPAVEEEVEAFPRWLNRDFVQRLHLQERYEEIRATRDDRPKHPVRPAGYASFAVLPWQFLFEMYDPEVTGLPLEVRHPYSDIRMIRYLLAVPVIPWCRNKFLMREALRPLLPEEVVKRPKEGLCGFPNYERWKRSGMPDGLPEEAASEYVNFNELRRCKIGSAFVLGGLLRPYALGIFIAQRCGEVL
jgi:asparagine synthase (glutamine-hydrolysing)